MNTVFFYIIFAIEMTNLLDKPSEHHTESHAHAVEKYLTNECTDADQQFIEANYRTMDFNVLKDYFMISISQPILRAALILSSIFFLSLVLLWVRT